MGCCPMTREKVWFVVKDTSPLSIGGAAALAGMGLAISGDLGEPFPWVLLAVATIWRAFAAGRYWNDHNLP